MIELRLQRQDPFSQLVDRLGQGRDVRLIGGDGPAQFGDRAFGPRQSLLEFDRLRQREEVRGRRALPINHDRYADFV